MGLDYKTLRPLGFKYKYWNNAKVTHIYKTLGLHWIDYRHKVFLYNYWRVLSIMLIKVFVHFILSLIFACKAESLPLLWSICDYEKYIFWFIKFQEGTYYESPEKEDPTVYISNKTNRGPLTPDWLEEYWPACQVTTLLNLSSSHLTSWQNKLACLSLASVFNLV